MVGSEAAERWHRRTGAGGSLEAAAARAQGTKSRTLATQAPRATASLAFVALGLVGAACSGGAGLGPDVIAEEQSVPVAHVDIEYSRAVGFESSQAIAHFVFSHEGRSARDAAPLSAIVSGSRATIPEPGRCQDLTDASLTAPSPVELLAAGSVTIHTTAPKRLAAQNNLRPVNGAGPVDGAGPGLLDGHGSVDGHDAVDGPQLDDDAPKLDSTQHEPSHLDEESAIEEDALVEAAAEEEPVTISLAPRAFPGVSTLAAGVMYTSRDREIPLPASAEYRVDIEGSSQVPSMSLLGTAPAYLTHVTVGGTPLEQLAYVNTGSPIDITWDIGAAEDLVVVDVTNPHNGQAVLRCSYPDASGAGTVPWVSTLGDLAAASSQAGLRVHRLRVVETTAGVSGAVAGGRGELRFDFELTRDVEFR